MYSSVLALVTRIGGGAARRVWRSDISHCEPLRSRAGKDSGVLPLYKAKRISPLKPDVQASRRSRWLLISALRGYSINARTPTSGSPPVTSLRARLLSIGTRKHSVFPEPVPLATTSDSRFSGVSVSHART